MVLSDPMYGVFNLFCQQFSEIPGHNLYPSAGLSSLFTAALRHQLNSIWVRWSYEGWRENVPSGSGRSLARRQSMEAGWQLSNSRPREHCPSTVAACLRYQCAWSSLWGLDDVPTAEVMMLPILTLLEGYIGIRKSLFLCSCLGFEFGSVVWK